MTTNSRDVILEALADWSKLNPLACMFGPQREAVADALAPAVDRARDESAAEALSRAADQAPWYTRALGSVVPVWRLRERAAALTVKNGA